jgi:hypothetical protein
VLTLPEALEQVDDKLLCGILMKQASSLGITQRVLLPVVVVAALVGCATAPDESQLRSDGLRPMTQQALEAEFATEKRCRFDNWNRATGTVVYRPDGRFEGDAGGAAFEGRYRIREGLMCSKASMIRGGVEVCHAVYRTPQGERVAFGREDGSWTRTRCTSG